MKFSVELLIVLLFALANCALSSAQQDDVSKESNDTSDKLADKSELDNEPLPASNKIERVKAGRSVSRSYDFKEADKEMTYRLYLPKNYYAATKSDSNKKFPLIIALHGYGSNPQQIVGYPGFFRQAEKRGYIIVAPMGYNKRGWYGSHGQKGGYGDDPRNLGDLSEKDVLNVLEIAKNEFKIDERRIYIYGHSMGGGGSIHLAMKYPEKWAAVAPMAPAMPWGLKNLGKAKKIPFYVVHGDKDKVLAVSKTRKFVEKMKELKMDHVYREVKNGDHVTVAWKYFDEIFDFFDKHGKASAKANAKLK